MVTTWFDDARAVDDADPVANLSAVQMATMRFAVGGAVGDTTLVAPCGTVQKATMFLHHHQL